MSRPTHPCDTFGKILHFIIYGDENKNQMIALVILFAFIEDIIALTSIATAVILPSCAHDVHGQVFSTWLALLSVFSVTVPYFIVATSYHTPKITSCLWVAYTIAWIYLLISGCILLAASENYTCVTDRTFFAYFVSGAWAMLIPHPALCAYGVRKGREFVLAHDIGKTVPPPPYIA